MAYTDEQIGFHDSSLTKITQSDGSVALHLGYVSFGDDLFSAIATISDIEAITRDDVTIEEFRMETEDGEILRLDFERDRITLTVIWHKYAPRSRDVNIYQLSGKRIGSRSIASRPPNPSRGA